MRRAFSEEPLEPPISSMRIKAGNIIYYVCPKCKRENGQAQYIKNTAFISEKICWLPHGNLKDCIKALWHAPYTQSLPLDVVQNIAPPKTYRAQIINTLNRLTRSFRKIVVMYLVS